MTNPLEYSQQQTADAYDSIITEADNGEYPYYAHEIAVAFIAKYMEHVGTEGEQVWTELGCSTGGMYGELLDNGIISPAKYLGIDISPASVSSAAEQHPESSFMVGDVIDDTLSQSIRAHFETLGLGLPGFLYSGYVMPHAGHRNVIKAAADILPEGGTWFLADRYYGEDDAMTTTGSEMVKGLVNLAGRILSNSGLLTAAAKSGHVMGIYQNPHFQKLTAQIKSNAINKNDFLALLEDDFDIIDSIDMGGSMLLAAVRKAPALS